MQVVDLVMGLAVDWLVVQVEGALLQPRLHPAYLVNSSPGQCLIPLAASEQGRVHWEEVEEEPCFCLVSAVT